MNVRRIGFTAREQAELVVAPPPGELGAEQVRGRTLCTLISPGTELAWGYCGAKFPSHPGYAAVFEVQEVGARVTKLRPGQRVFCPGGHCSVQQWDESKVLPVPDGLPPETAVLARLMGVSMTTLKTTLARPGDRVMVTGAGPVGFLGAHLFARSGYEVWIVEPDERRHPPLKRAKFAGVLPCVPVNDASFAGSVALALECSGHEQAVLDACKVVRKRGEVVLVGVPWSKRTNLTAFDILHAVFHRYVVLRSGWEWEMPYAPADFQPHSIIGGFALALTWLKEGLVDTAGLVRRYNPADAQTAYQDLLHRRNDELFCLFDWAMVNG